MNNPEIKTITTLEPVKMSSD